MKVGGGGVYIYHAVVIASNHASSGNAINLDRNLFFIYLSGCMYFTINTA